MSHELMHLFDMHLTARRLGLSSADHYLQQAYRLHESESAGGPTTFNHCGSV